MNNFPLKTLKLGWVAFHSVTFQLKCLDFQSNQYKKLVLVLSRFCNGLFPHNFHANQVCLNDCAIAKFLNSLGKINGKRTLFPVPYPNSKPNSPPPPLSPPGRQTHYSRGRGGHLRGLGPRGRKLSVTLLRLRNIIIILFSRCVVLNNFVFAYRQVFVEYYERARPSSS